MKFSGERQISGALFSLALPIMLNMLVFQVQVIVNRIFLGQVETAWLAVVSNVVFPMWTCMAMLNALATGATIVMSHRIGAGDASAAQRLSMAALVGNSLVSLVLFLFWSTSSRLVYSLMGVEGALLESCVSYTGIASFMFLGTGISGAITAIFQASARTRPLMIAGIAKSLVTILFDYLLIFGHFGAPKLGLEGAAVAGVIAEAVGLAILAAILVFSKQLEARPVVKSIRDLKLTGYPAVVRMGLPTSLEEMLWNVGNLVLIGFMNRLDPLATAVYGIVFTIEILPIVMFVSLGQAATILAGRAKGAGDIPRVRSVVSRAQIIAWIASLVTLILFTVVPEGFVGLFTQDASIIAWGAPILIVSCITLFPRSANIVVGSGIRGMGNTRWMLGTQIFGTVFVVSLGFALVFPAGLGVMGLFIAMCADEIVRSVVNTLRFARMTRPIDGSRSSVVDAPIPQESST